MLKKRQDELIARQAGLNGELGTGKRPAVIVVDFTLAFTDPECPLGSDATEELKHTSRVLSSARNLDIPVFFTAVSFDAGLADAGLWVKKLPGLKHLQKGTRWANLDTRADIDPILEIRESEVVIVRKGASSFFGTNLSALLTSLGVDTVILSGCSTSGCVRATAQDAIHLGYHTLVARECVLDRVQAAHDSNLFDIQSTIGDVVSVDFVIEYFETLRS